MTVSTAVGVSGQSPDVAKRNGIHSEGWLPLASYAMRSGSSVGGFFTRLVKQDVLLLQTDAQ